MNGHDLDRPEIIDEAPLDTVITEDFIRRLEIAADLYQTRYLPLAIRLTNAGDWVKQGSKYFLQASGAEKLCNPFGVVWERPIVTRHEREDSEGKFYEYEIEGVIKSGALRRWGWFTGNCNSRDKFFLARPGWDPSNGEGDIRKSAFSNWLGQGVTRLLGIRNPTPEMLAAGGLKVDQVGAIDYSGKGSRTVEQAGDVISEAQGKRFYAIGRGAGWTEEQMKAMLGSFGIESSRAIPRNKYEELCALVGKPPAGEPA